MQFIVRFFNFVAVWFYNHCFSTNTKAVVTGSGVFTALTEINDFQVANFLLSSLIFIVKGCVGSIIGLLFKRLVENSNVKKGGAGHE